MIDVAHDGHDRRTRREVVVFRIGAGKALFDVRFRNAFHGVAEIGDNQLGGVGVEHRVRRHHLSLLHQFTNQVDRAHRHALGEVLNSDGFGNDDLAHDGEIAGASLLAGELFALTGAFD